MKPRAWRPIVAVVLLAVALVLGIPKWRILFVALWASASYFPDFPYWPLWLPLGGLVLGYLAYFLLALAMGKEANAKHLVMVTALFFAVVVARFSGQLWTGSGGSMRGESDAPPQLMMARAATHLRSRLEQRARDSEAHAYPIDAIEIEELLRGGKKLPLSGYRSHGIRAPVRLAVFHGADGPVLDVRSGDRAGMLYYAVNEDGSRFWITLVGLRNLPAGPPAILVAANNQPLVFDPDVADLPAED